MRFLRRFLCTMFGHPRGMIFTGAGGWFCPACVRDMPPAKTEEPKP